MADGSDPFSITNWIYELSEIPNIINVLTFIKWIILGIWGPVLLIKLDEGRKNGY